MKTLKRLDLKKCTELKSAEMKDILGGGALIIGPTCGPGSSCGKSCVTGGRSGICKVVDMDYGGCDCVVNKNL